MDDTPLVRLIVMFAAVMALFWPYLGQMH